MTERNYICEVCRAKFESGHADTPVKIVGVHWVTNNDWALKSNRECETHICVNCLKAAARAYRDSDWIPKAEATHEN